MLNLIKVIIKFFFNLLGFELIKLYKVPEKSLLGLKNIQFNTVLDIGANIGQSSKLYRKLFPDATIYSFEPLPNAFEKLSDWAKSQNGKVIPLNFALGNSNGKVKMKDHVNFSPSSSILESTDFSKNLFPQTCKQKEVVVDIVKLDDFQENIKIEPELLIKMDVQGFEKNVIDGGRQVFSKATACIMEISFQPLYKGQPNFKELHSIMDELGFKYAGNLLQVYDKTGSVIYLDAVFKKNDK